MTYAIAGGHELTVQAAEEILKTGGNAIDAAIAAFVMSWVTEPCMSSAGGGAFAMVHQKGNSPILFDFFCQTPQSKRPTEELDFVPIEVDFGDTVEIFYAGQGSTAVPGAVAGIFAMHKYGGNMPMAELVQPAIGAAKEGVTVNRFQQLDFQLLEPILRRSGKAEQLFFKEGTLVQVGDQMQMPQLADFLEILAKEGADLFYKGEVAQSIVRDYAIGGDLTLKDFSDYQVIWRKPLQLSYGNYELFTNPAPSLGGPLIAKLLQLLDGKAKSPHLASEHILKWYEALRTLEQIPRQPAYIQQLIQKEMQTRRGSTTHFNVVDGKGNAVSLTSTNGEGNGYFIDHTDIQLNNMLGEAALLPKGYHTWLPNQRLSSMMAPSMVFDTQQQLEITLGSGGAGRIATAITQVLHLLLDHQLPLAEAVQAPRVHLEKEVFNMEYGFAAYPSSQQLDRPGNAWKEQSLYFGGVHTVARHGNGWVAVGDQRRDGVARSGGG